MRQNDRKSVGLRTVICIALLVVAYLLQTTFAIQIFGTHIDILPLIVAASAVLMGSPVGMICGLIAGILYDASGIRIEGIYPIYYMICGIVCGYMGDKFRGREWLCTTGCSVGIVISLNVLRYVFYFQFEQAGMFPFLCDVFVQAIVAAVCSIPVFWLVRKIYIKKQKSTPQPEI